MRARARELLIDLIRQETVNPPGNEALVARRLKQIADEYAIESELLGDDPDRLNFVARLRGSGEARPLLLMAHTDVVPAEAPEWSVPPFAGEIRAGQIWGRGAVDDKNLLAAEMAVLIELKQRRTRLKRDVVLVAEADEESGSTGMRWLLLNAADHLDAEAALNEGGFAADLPSKTRVFHIQTTEKIPTRVTLIARGTSGHASLPRPDNAILRLSRALLRLDAEQPVRLNATTRRHLSELARTPDYDWLGPLIRRLEDPRAQIEAAAQIRSRDPELDAQLRTSISPTMLRAGLKINVIPGIAEAQVDVRRLPDESREEVLTRLRRMVHDEMVEIEPAGGQEMPPAEPSPIGTPVYRTMERVLAKSARRALVVPFMSRGATDGAFLRERGIPVYGVPIFLREDGEGRAHANDERISIENLEAGTELLWRIVKELVE